MHEEWGGSSHRAHRMGARGVRTMVAFVAIKVVSVVFLKFQWPHGQASRLKNSSCCARSGYPYEDDQPSVQKLTIFHVQGRDLGMPFFNIFVTVRRR